MIGGGILDAEEGDSVYCLIRWMEMTMRVVDSGEVSLVSFRRRLVLWR